VFDEEWNAFLARVQCSRGEDGAKDYRHGRRERQSLGRRDGNCAPRPPSGWLRSPQPMMFQWLGRYQRRLRALRRCSRLGLPGRDGQRSSWRPFLAHLDVCGPKQSALVSIDGALGRGLPSRRSGEKTRHFSAVPFISTVPFGTW